jgi:DNA-damage-inducible protein J
MPTVQIATRIDEAQSRLFRETATRLGTTPADALRMFVSAFNEHHGFPYPVQTVEPYTTARRRHLSAAEREARDRRDIELINAHADRINAGAEENLEFQADIWEDQ